MYPWAQKSADCLVQVADGLSGGISQNCQKCEQLWRLGLLTMLFQQRVSLLQKAIPFDFIFFGQGIPNFFQPGCEFHFHVLSLAYRGRKGDQVFTLLSAEAKGITRSPWRIAICRDHGKTCFICRAPEGKVCQDSFLKVKQPANSTLSSKGSMPFSTA